MKYVTIADLSQQILQSLDIIPHDIDLIVGIPRSGLLPANILALYLNVQLTDIDSFTEGRIYGSGYRMNSIEPHSIKKVLVVDDSVCSGRAMLEAKSKIQHIAPNYEITYFAPIVSSRGRDFVDIFCTVIDEYRVFEWNVFHHKILSNACIDIDGVLCKDPDVDDDGPIYRQFISTATPLIIPTVPVKTIVSCRLEKYRELTVNWLRMNSISYEELIMLDFPDKATRVKWGRHGEYKADFYKNSTAELFIESSASQAEIIAQLSHKPVLCIETNQLLFYESFKEQIKRRASKRAPKMYQWLKQLINNV